MDVEMAALKDKRILRQIPRSELPSGQQTIKTMCFLRDINTAYLNAALGIKQYLEEVEGYPCDDNGMKYIIEKDLYGLRQSGREWHSEVNRWFVEYGFNQCETARIRYRTFLDKDYGLKDQGLLNTYLDVQVEQNADSIKIHQTKYCEKNYRAVQLSGRTPK
ncbi:Retrotransposon Polyprotein [Phytophthora palmivora]|uniref:Retrotransposon Polyprotein n=1 Tax=Phytophthora palmivora TaxID=4796 RepID=A0A2P4YV26_9STRA|nr:Retrotransposon Polyprotein [Phytophthora palmivora]